MKRIKFGVIGLESGAMVGLGRSIARLFLICPR